MPVIDQITEATDRFFDAAEKNHGRAHEATKTFVIRIQDAELPFADRFESVEVPFADRLPEINLPLIDRLPEPIEAVDAYFDFLARGIENTSEFAEKVMNRFAEIPAEEPKAAPAKAKAAPAKAKATAKKAPASKPAKKTPAKN